MALRYSDLGTASGERLLRNPAGLFSKGLTLFLAWPDDQGSGRSKVVATEGHQTTLWEMLGYEPPPARGTSVLVVVLNDLFNRVSASLEQ